MSVTYDDVVKAVGDAERTLRHVDQQSTKMASLLRGRLRNVGCGCMYSRKRILGSLKRELQDFNANTGEWKS
jgi:hypothetical protein